MDWYKSMERMYDDEVVPLGTVQITGRLIKGVLALLALFAANHFYQLSSGGVSWFGYRETSIRDAPKWMHTPISTNLVRESYGVGLPMPAQVGQEVVVHYDLQPSAGTTASAKIMVSCGFPCRSWTHFEISGPGSGELVVPVTDPDFYRYTLWQSASSDGSAAAGTFWIGVREKSTAVQSQ